jgi:hypothetical protein
MSKSRPRDAGVVEPVSLPLAIGGSNPFPPDAIDARRISA